MIYCQYTINNIILVSGGIAMTKAELEKRLEEQNKIIDKQKRRIKAQNEKAKQNWDTVSCRLPKGTKDKIISHGFTVNGFINDVVLNKLSELDGE